MVGISKQPGLNHGIGTLAEFGSQLRIKRSRFTSDKLANESTGVRFGGRMQQYVTEG